MSLLPISKPVAETPLASPVATDWRPEAGETGAPVTDPALVAYLEWVAAANEVERMFAGTQVEGISTAEQEALHKACGAAEERRDEAADTLEAASATTPAGVLGKLAYFTWITSSCMVAADIRFWQGMIADIARLGIVPLEVADVAPFGEGRQFGPLHRAAMSPEGIDPTGRSITLPSSLWEPTIEQAGVVYPLPVGVAEMMVAEERRIRVVNEENARRNPEEVRAREERLLTNVRRVSDAQQEAVLRWLEFGVTGSHLHAAELRFAQENGWLDEYRERLIRRLKDVADAEFRADLEELAPQVRSAFFGLIRASVHGDRAQFEAAVEAFRRCEQEHGFAADLTVRAIALATDTYRRRIGEKDADLLAAFDQWVILARQMDADGVDEAAADAAYETSKEFSRRLETIKPRTLEGVAVVLRYLFAKHGEGLEHYQPVVNGTEPNELALSDYRDRLLWQVIQAVEAMAGVQRKSGVKPPPDQETEILTAFSCWLDACESPDAANPSAEGYATLVKAERENCNKVVSLPAPTAAAALAKLACLAELASDTFRNDEDHPAHLAIKTLQEAVEHLPVTAARSVRLALKGILLLSDGYNAQPAGAR